MYNIETINDINGKPYFKNRDKSLLGSHFFS